MPMGIMKGAGTSSKPSYPARRPNSAFKDDSAVAGRVRVAIRLRPQNAEEVATDADFADCVELQPELKRLKLRKNNWNTETFQFDEVFTETASQKRVYEVVAKPVVESVLNGYNGTVMAYGQTGTGKTFTLGQLGTKDSADRGIIVRALEDILADMNPALDIVTVSYLQLYLETVQDLLAPDKDNIPIIEDPKSGDVSFPGATMVQVHDHTDFLQLLETGEANRFAANTKLNTESSRSHAILLVYIKKSLREKENDIPLPNKNGSIKLSKELSVSSIRKSKLLIVDLAGSERIDKSGSDGHTLEEAKSINLSLTALGKCINALAENSSHIPARDSKLTRLLRDSFGGTARTSLVVTVGPSSRHRGETASTIMFGQRAMKLENMVKLKEEFDYKSLCRKLESQVDILIAQNENASKLALDTVQDLEKQLEESHRSLIDAERRLSISLEEEVQAERKMYQHELVTISQLHQQKMLEISDKLEAECSENEMLRRELFEVKKSLYEKIYEELQAEKQMHQDELGTISQLHQQEIVEIKHKLEAECSENETLKRKLYETKQSLYEQDEKIHVLEEEIKRYKKECADMEKMYLEEMSEMEQKIHAEHAKSAQQQQKMRALEKSISEQDKKIEAREQTEVVELRKKLEEQIHHQGNLEKKLRALQSDKEEASVLKEKCNKEMEKMRKKLEDEKKHKGMVKDEVNVLKEQILYLSSDINENTDSIQKGNSGKLSIASESPATFPKSIQIRNTISGQRAKIAKLFENVGLPKIVSYLESADKDVRIHAVKVVANLATEELNQVTIVEAGGLSSLLMLLETSEDETIQRVAAGAIANLAMNEKNQEFIMMQGGVKLLAKTANKAEDPQTLQMVGGALANLCGNDKLQARLRDEGGIKALIGMVRSGHSDVLAQVARGVANFAKCESRGATEGHHKGRSLLIDDGALPWIVANSNNEAISVTRHVELALCHLSSHEANAKDIVSFGAFWELVRISRECSREDIRNLAKRALNTSPTFQMELRRVHFTRG